MEKRNDTDRKEAMRFPFVGIMELQGLEFHANHGCLEQERRDGNLFVVDFTATLNGMEKAARSDNLDDTVDTREIYAIIKEEMEKPRNLLECVAGGILSAVLGRYSASFTYVKVSVAKHNPPFDGKCEWSRISAEWKNE